MPYRFGVGDGLSVVGEVELTGADDGGDFLARCEAGRIKNIGTRLLICL